MIEHAIGTTMLSSISVNNSIGVNLKAVINPIKGLYIYDIIMNVVMKNAKLPFIVFFL